MTLVRTAVRESPSTCSSNGPVRGLRAVEYRADPSSPSASKVKCGGKRPSHPWAIGWTITSFTFRVQKIGRSELCSPWGGRLRNR